MCQYILTKYHVDKRRYLRVDCVAAFTILSWSLNDSDILVCISDMILSQEPCRSECPNDLLLGYIDEDIHYLEEDDVDTLPFTIILDTPSFYPGYEWVRLSFTHTRRQVLERYQVEFIRKCIYSAMEADPWDPSSSHDISIRVSKGLHAEGLKTMIYHAVPSKEEVR